MLGNRAELRVIVKIFTMNVFAVSTLHPVDICDRSLIERL